MGGRLSRNIGQRPLGISIISVLEVVGGVLGLVSASQLFDYANKVSGTFYDDGTGGLAQNLGIAAAAGGLAAIVVAYGLWTLRPWAWPAACILAAVSIGFEAFALFNHGDTVSIIINVAANAGILYYLSTEDVRALFGRSSMGKPPGR